MWATVILRSVLLYRMLIGRLWWLLPIWISLRYVAILRRFYCEPTLQMPTRRTRSQRPSRMV